MAADGGKGPKWKVFMIQKQTFFFFFFPFICASVTLYMLFNPNVECQLKCRGLVCEGKNPKNQNSKESSFSREYSTPLLQHYQFFILDTRNPFLLILRKRICKFRVMKDPWFCWCATLLLCCCSEMQYFSTFVEVFLFILNILVFVLNLIGLTWML